MLVCHCQAVNEQRIRDVIASGARDEFDVSDACGAGSDCGGCVPVVSALLAEAADCGPGCPVTTALRRPAPVGNQARPA